MDHPRGIITGCDKNVEMFLPWWFDNLQKHSDLPIAIIDYGLSDWGKRAAQNMGTLIQKKSISIAKCKHQPSKAYPKRRHDARDTYLYKPFGLQQSPFNQTIWLDVDCKIQSSLDLLFDTPGFGIVINDSYGQEWAQKYKIFRSSDTLLLNSGVLVFKKNCSVIKAWADKTLSEGADYVLEDVLLSELIFDKKLPITYLPESYNAYWPLAKEDTCIVHYKNPSGKAIILQEMMAKVCGAPDAR